MSDLLSVPESSTVETQGAPLLATEQGINLTVNRIAELVEVQSPAQIDVQSSVGTLTVYAPGPVGARGPAGPQGPAGGPINQLSQLEDVLLVNLSDANLLKYHSGLQKWTNSQSVDGGSF